MAGSPHPGMEAPGRRLPFEPRHRRPVGQRRFSNQAARLRIPWRAQPVCLHVRGLGRRPRRPMIAAMWLIVLRRYLLISAFGNLAWEFAHLPLYTIWQQGTPTDIIFAAVHCTGGDILIAIC